MADADKGFRLQLLLQRVGAVAGGLALSQVLSGIAYVIAARTLGPSRFGVYAAGIAIATVASALFDFGLVPIMVRDIAAGRLRPAAAHFALARKRKYAWLVVPALFPVVLLLVRDVLGAAALAFIFLGTWEALVANGLLRSRERFAAGVVGQFCGRALGLPVVWLLSTVGSLEAALPIGLALGFSVEALVDRAFLRPRLGGRDAHISWWVLQRQASSYGLTTLGAVSQQLDTPLVALGGGAAAAGLYAAAGRLLGPLGFLSSALANVAAPWLARAHGTASSLLREERKIARVALALALAPLAAAAAGPIVLPLILGSAYKTSGLAFAVLAVGSVFSTMNQSLAVVVQNRQSQDWVAASVGIGLVLGLGSTLLFAHAGGAVLAAWGYTIGHLLILIILRLRLQRLRRASSAHR